uniref:Binding-protein-dependent transport systems inner membrane component n=1 Tax=uncultured bacterium contig00002 TaxID=1181494 RepID=A0A806JYF6_9BACT|nr:binding-protein-dependent transport systems inner membrane component [uncultured bacterium contig00002]
MSFAGYVGKRRETGRRLVKEIIGHRVCYLFLAPYAVVFILFFVAPLVISIFYSFTYFNILEPPKFIGLQNYINLLLADDVFLISLKNTFIMAAITGPIGYVAAFLFAWFINELPRYVRAVVTLVFYAPSISGGAYMIWALIFSGDAYGYINGLLINLGILNAPVLWLTDPKYMMPVMLVVILWMSLGAGFLAFIAGLSTIDPTLYEAGLVDGITNRWQELWYITLPNMKGMLMFGAVMAITQSFGVADVTIVLAGFPSTDYAVHTVVNHLIDYGSIRFEMGYASAIATILFLTMIVCNAVIQKLLRRVGT